MGSYNRFPRCGAAGEIARRRAQDWLEDEFRQALRAQPRPDERVDTSKFVGRIVERSEVSGLLSAAGRPTLH